MDTYKEPDNQRDSTPRGLIKYGIAWLLGVPLTLLLVILLFARGC